LDDYKKIYETHKLMRTINDTLDKTNSVSGKQALAAIIEKLQDYQAEEVKMTEYDLKLLQQQYDLEVARLALEESRNTKT
jgi:aspartate/glutamate racemase